jgi:hypothetical protein
MQNRLIISTKAGQFVVEDRKEVLDNLIYNWKLYLNGFEEKTLTFSFIEPQINVPGCISQRITVRMEDILNLLELEVSNLARPDISIPNIGDIMMGRSVS